MAVIYPSLSAAWYGFPGGTSWTSSSVIYSGVSNSSNYRSKVQVNVGDFDGTASHLIVSLTIDGTSSPAGMYGVLSTRNDIYPKQTVSDTYYGSYTNGPHPDYLASGCTGYIAESDTYSDAACTTLQGSYNQSSGHTVYLKFSSSAIAPNTTYYLYLMRYIKSGDSTSSGWTRGQLSAMTATLTYTQNTYYIDVNTYINGGGSTTNANITYNVDINGTRVASGVQDYYTAWPKGTTWNIACASHSGYTCTNYTNTSGTLGTSAVASQWSFSSLHTLTLNPNGGSFSNGSTSALALSPNLIYGQGNWWDISDFPVTKPGHTCSGWYTAASGGTKVYNTDGSCVTGTAYWNSSKHYTQAADLTVYAQWTPDTYAISYSPNGGSSTPENQTKTYGVTLTLRGAISRPNATKTITTTLNGNGGTPLSPTISSIASLRYSFAGWKATNGTVYSAGGSYTANEGTTLTAQWNSGEWEGEAIILPDASRAGYSFAGWYTAATGGSRVTSLSPTANTTLYAHWSANSYVVSLVDDWTGNYIDTYEINYGDTITLPALSTFSPVYDPYGEGSITIDTGATDTFTIEGTRSEKRIASYFRDTRSNDSFTTASYTLEHDADVTIRVMYEYAGIDVFRCTLPYAFFFDDDPYKTIAYFTRLAGPSFMPTTITPTSYFEVQYVYDDYTDSDFGSYQAIYRPEIGVRTWIKQDGTYKLATAFVKNGSSYGHNDGYLIKHNGRWMSIAEYLGLPSPDSVATTLDSGLLDSIILQ